MSDETFPKFIAVLAQNKIPIGKLAFVAGGLNTAGGHTIEIVPIDGEKPGFEALVEILESTQGSMVIFCEPESGQEKTDRMAAANTFADSVHLLFQQDRRIQKLVNAHPERMVLALLENGGLHLLPEGLATVKMLCAAFSAELQRSA